MSGVHRATIIMLSAPQECVGRSEKCLNLKKKNVFECLKNLSANLWQHRRNRRNRRNITIGSRSELFCYEVSVAKLPTYTCRSTNRNLFLDGRRRKVLATCSCQSVGRPRLDVESHRVSRSIQSIDNLTLL